MDNSTTKSATSSNVIIDLRGLRCPLPAIRSRAFFATADKDKHHVILTTDETAVRDIPLALQDLGWTCVSAHIVPGATLPTWEMILAPHHQSREPA